MSKKISTSSLCSFLISLVLVTCGPAVAQYTDRLGGNWNYPAGAMITNIVMDRMARRQLEKRLGAKHSAPGSTANTARSGANETAAPLNDGVTFPFDRHPTQDARNS